MVRGQFSGGRFSGGRFSGSGWRFIACWVSVVVVSFGLPAASQEPETGSGTTWLQWRGAARDGTVGGPTWPETLELSRLEKMWHADLGPSYSGPLVAEKLIYVTETRTAKTEHVRALDRATGREVWQVEWDGAMSVPFFAASNGSWIRATPLIDRGRIFVAGMRDVLVCLDAASGAEQWRVDFVKELKSEVPAFGFVSSPLVIGDAVYVQAGGGFCKLDTATGKILWRVLDDGGGMNGSAFSSPLVCTLGGRKQILVQGRNDLAAIDPDSGEVLWKRPVEAFRGMNIVTPSVSDGKIFTTSYGGGSFLFDSPPAGGQPGEPLWRNKVQGYMSTPIVRDGQAYVHLRNQRFACLDLTTGKENWITTPYGKYWSLVAQGERILALDETGDLRLVRATPEKFVLLGEAQVSQRESWAHLAVTAAPDGATELWIRDISGITAWRWK
ncbi:MAG: pyrrolo-quinoline quinone [Planctomycetota bacterium]|nr:MAG: pyrrolo-quinoline quinone [Planctomycetota bacterium]